MTAKQLAKALRKVAKKESKPYNYGSVVDACNVLRALANELDKKR